ncbi:hypothetical protein KM800_10770 [Clostridium tyrobutyricum]|uniref:hypothetical protein n=1 Tax=Clostridium tyrobutyricum TaxID=1519 RepID=UPI001C37EDB9|nr:hypothetical protein [Clostridium tyrobutyricum]MBV4419798.1 hypothetical protein [Clostridium tyrobutyricum]
MINIVSSVITKHNIMNTHRKNDSVLDKLNKNLVENGKFTADDFKVDQLRTQLRNSQIAEQHIQEGMSLLQEKRKAVTSLQEMSNQLKQLSIQYRKDNCTSQDKQSIEKQAKEIIENMNSIMNNTFGDKSAFSGRTVSAETSDGSNIIVDMNLSLSLDKSGDKKSKDNNKNYTDDIHIEGNLSIDDILENTNAIENNLIKPLDKYLNEIHKQMTGLFNDVLYQDMVLDMATKGLSSLGELDVYQARTIMENSDIIVKNAGNALYCQSGNLDKNTVGKLIR